MLSDVRSTAAECLAELARDDRERLIEGIEWLARQIEAGPDDIGGRSLYSNGCLDVSKLARRVRRLASCVTAPHLVSPDEALAPNGVAPLGEAGDMGFIVHGHVDRAEALRRARKVPCLADLLNGPRHDEQELEHGHFHAVFAAAPADSDQAWFMRSVDAHDPQAIPVTASLW